MEIVKNIAALLGLITSISAVITICSKSARAFIAGVFKKYGNENDMKEIARKLDKITEKLDNIEQSNNITVDFTREQCRGLIKDMFYCYYDNKTLPLYEYKWLLKLEDLYINRLHGNSFVAGLIKEMKTWTIDYSKTHAEEDE